MGFSRVLAIIHRKCMTMPCILSWGRHCTNYNAHYCYINCRFTSTFSLTFFEPPYQSRITCNNDIQAFLHRLKPYTSPEPNFWNNPLKSNYISVSYRYLNGISSVSYLYLVGFLFERVLVWAGSCLSGSLFEQVLVWANSCLSGFLFERVLVWAGPCLSGSLFERVLAWASSCLNE